MRSDKEVPVALAGFSLYEPVAVPDYRTAEIAAHHYRLLRAKGITVRKTINSLIAARCIMDRIPLLYRDRDFDLFVEHLGLISALDLPGLN